MRFLLIAALLVALLPLPAEAHQVVLKDGRTFDGAIRIEGEGVTITTADGKVESIPYAAVHGIALDGQPVYSTARNVEGSKLLNNDWLLWTAVGANVATMVVAGVMMYRAFYPGRTTTTTP